ncbi:TRAP transporter substrate-binding protein DctP [Pseudonocardia nematodicida]|uniref:TRAP transporter substrate-binding protein DctP n=1 Tax=Pseudonocardia nematodicida TaxID=1206997 RepID=A0ABV1K4A5_9PSEU
MSTTRRTGRRASLAAAAVSSALLLAACGGGAGAEPGGDITLSFSSSQPETAPNVVCGTQLFKDKIEAAGLGITVDLFPGSQLGPDTERVTQIQAGDLDMDLQEAGISAEFPKLGVLGAAYVFDDVDHAFDWLDNDSAEVFAEFNEATDMTIVDAWYYGSRTFSSNDPIRSPEDLAGMAVRFPDTPQYLANAAAMGANPVAVAYEEIYVALQQGIAQAQENPVVGTKAGSYDEVQNYVSLNEHQVSLHYVTMSDATLERLDDAQRQAVIDTVKEVRAENRECVERETEEVLEDWRQNGPLQVIDRDEVDRQAFMDRSEAYFADYYTGEDLEFYNSVRATAGNAS